MRILLVEDEPTIRALISKYLTRLEHKVVKAPDGMVACQLYTEAGFDLVITDIQMPEMSGLQLYHQLRRLNPQQDILFISGSSLPVPEGETCLRKPFEMAKLAEHLDRVVL